MVAVGPIATDRLADFCRRWRIRELSLFGSAVRDELRPGSDIDVMVLFEEGAVWEPDERDRLDAELSALLGRRAGVINGRFLRNPFVRRQVLDTRRVLYAA